MKTPQTTWARLDAVAVDRGGSLRAGYDQIARQIGAGHRARPYTLLLRWRERRTVPAERVVALARATGLSPETIRPDIYGVTTCTPTE